METNKTLPTTLWIAIIAMGIFAIIHLIIGFSKSDQFIAFAINSILLTGLYFGKKWAYIFTVVFSILIPLPLVAIKSDITTSIIILMLNSIVLIPLLLSTKYFYPSSN